MAKQVYTTGQILTAAQMTTLQANDFNQTVSAKVASYTLVAADAGTRITMSNASATTITVNTAIFTAGDTLQITNIGAGVLTVTAGTATVSTSSTLALKQFDSGQLYFTSTGVAIFFASDAADSPLTTKGDLFTFSTVDARLAVGSNGEALVADSSTLTGLKYTSSLTSLVTVTTSADSTFNGVKVGRGLNPATVTNTAIGNNALVTVTSGTNNVAVGQNALKLLTTAALSTAVGDDALAKNTTGNFNTAVGQAALRDNTTASSSTAFGANSLLVATGGENAGFGFTTLNANTSGVQNVAIGATAGTSNTTGSNNIMIGYNAQGSTATTSNGITLGNSSHTVLRCQVTSITALSDQRDKANIVPLEIGLDFVNKLKPVTFDWNMRQPAEPKIDSEGNSIIEGKVGIADTGFIAQDIIKIEDEIAGHDYLQLSYRDNPDQLEITQGRLVPILVKAIQDLSAKIAILEAGK